MTFITKEEIADLTVEKMIFHIVGPHEADFLILDEVDPKGLEDFFLERVRETCRGNLFSFNPDSDVMHNLNKISDDPELFIEKSKRLAKDFNKAHANMTMTKGVFLILMLSLNGQHYYSLIKYDHSTSITYKITDNKAILEALKDSFTKSKDAMKKSAFIKINGAEGLLYVKDTGDRKDITKYFSSFLEVLRKRTNLHLTERLRDAAINTAKACKGELSEEQNRRFRLNIWQAINNLNGFDPDNPDIFLTSCFGAISKDSKIPNTFASMVRRERIEGEAFDFDIKAINKPTLKYWKTIEGIEVKFPVEHEGAFINKIVDGDKTKITIETNGKIASEIINVNFK